MTNQKHYPMPAMTEQERDALIFALEILKPDVEKTHVPAMVKAVEITLAVLTQKELLPEGLNPSTKTLVLSFSKTLAEKLYKSEKKRGFSNEWANPDWQEKCLSDFHTHIRKGDPVDVAAYCAFMQYHGWATTPPPVPSLKPVVLPKEVTNVTNKYFEEGRDAVIECLVVQGFEVKDAE